MATTYWRGDDRTGSLWIKFYPQKGAKAERLSLETTDSCRADLIRRRVDLEIELRRPELRGLELPSRLIEILDLAAPPQPPATPAILLPPFFGGAFPGGVMPASPLIEEVLAEFLAYIAVENAPHHAQNKTGYLKKFFGAARMGLPGDEKGVFTGKTLEDVKAGDVRKMIDGLPVATKTKKHHREAFHALFEFAMKYGFFIPVNFRYPNPMSALPGYHEKNKPIVYLSQAEKDHLFEMLKPAPSVRAAADLMIHGGLRRAEALWLRKQDISPDLRFFSVVNKTDEEKDIESTLKTGERAVPIVPDLKRILEPYLETLDTEWLVPSPTGLLWIGENFGDKHRTLLRANKLQHTCLIYRHTFATDRAREGWSLFRIAKAMGNSIAVCEKYYAAFIDPSIA